MKKSHICLLVLCIIYFILSIIDTINIYQNISTGIVIFNIVRFVVVFIPLFALMFIKEKKWSKILAIIILGADVLSCVFSIITLITHQNELNNFITPFIQQIIFIIMPVIIITNYCLSIKDKQMSKLFYWISLIVCFSLLIVNIILSVLTDNGTTSVYVSVIRYARFALFYIILWFFLLLSVKKEENDMVEIN